MRHVDFADLFLCESEALRGVAFVEVVLLVSFERGSLLYGCNSWLLGLDDLSDWG